MRKRTLSGEQWREIISVQPGSGLSVAAFCRRRRLSAPSFYAWRRKLRERVTPRRPGEGFAEVRIAPEPATASSAIELRLSNGRGLLVRAGFERRTLLELLAALEHGAGSAVSDAAGGTALHHEAGR